MCNKGISKTRKIYFLRLAGRIIVFIFAILLFFFDTKSFEIAEDMKFFEEFSILHLLWGIWIFDMVIQLIPVKAHISIGSQKVFSSFYSPVKENVNYKSLKKYIKKTTVSAYKVMAIWLVLSILIGYLYYKGVINTSTAVLISVFFYVCDLVCVLIWCPFRLIMHNRCCTTCRIFNWDHLMMFSPLVMINSFFSWSLVLLSFIIWLVWEICVITNPERFWENSNKALKCSECTDKLCNKYKAKKICTF